MTLDPYKDANGLLSLTDDLKMDFANPLPSSDVLNDFDFDYFLRGSVSPGPGDSPTSLQGEGKDDHSDVLFQGFGNTEEDPYLHRYPPMHELRRDALYSHPSPSRSNIRGKGPNRALQNSTMAPGRR